MCFSTKVKARNVERWIDSSSPSTRPPKAPKASGPSKRKPLSVQPQPAPSHSRPFSKRSLKSSSAMAGSSAASSVVFESSDSYLISSEVESDTKPQAPRLVVSASGKPRLPQSASSKRPDANSKIWYASRLENAKKVKSDKKEAKVCSSSSCQTIPCELVYLWENMWDNDSVVAIKVGKSLVQVKGDDLVISDGQHAVVAIAKREILKAMASRPDD